MVFIWFLYGFYNGSICFFFLNNGFYMVFIMVYIWFILMVFIRFNWDRTNGFIAGWFHYGF